MSPESRVLHQAGDCRIPKAAYVQAMKGSPTPKALVRELDVASDYGQIYIFDPETQQDDWANDEESSAIFRAMDDAYESRRFVGYAKGMVDLLTPSQYNWKAPMRVEVCDAPPALDTDEWDHVVEVPLPVPSGTLCFAASGGREPIEIQIPAGTYRARLSGQGYVAGVEEIEGQESYRLSCAD
jgi:hypothetical protein